MTGFAEPGARGTRSFARAARAVLDPASRGARAILDPASRGARAILDVVLPPQCLSCGAITGSAGAHAALCAACWERVSFVSRPFCEACGFPFALGALGGESEMASGLCGACARRAPAFARARAVFAYDAASRGLVIGFKHSDRTHGAPAFAGWMARAGAELLADAEVIIPVPLHRARLWTRRYNQAALLGLALARQSGVPCLPGLLLRIRATPPQGRLGRLGRARNVRGAFAVNPKHRARLTGRRVLLVDDVFTTGATVEAAARALLAGGAEAVDVLTLARVARPL